MAKLIDSMVLPQGIRDLKIESLTEVVAELRDELIDTVAASGGHLASSLGVAELTVALHYVFDTPHDRLIWDVGHQAYIHKMITGRRAFMKTMRQKGGISGFPKRRESEFDAFGTGHAGTSISAAIGMSVAAARSGVDRRVVAVIGDGSMTSGMAFEALNHAGDLGLKNLIVVLNDNEMSISPNVGAISWFFSRTATSQTSTRARTKLKALHEKGYIPDMLFRALDRAEEATQGFMSLPAMLFEAFGFRYIGPVDGHNLQDLIVALRNAKEQDRAVLVHIATVKGKGYKPAELNPVKWHGVRPFNRGSGEFRERAEVGRAAPTYTAVFGDTLLKLAQADEKVVGITAAMADGTGLDRLQKALPERFFDVGICEEHAVTFAAGLSCEGFRPVCAIYSSFLQRAFDQIAHDVCLQNLPVVFAIDRAGAVGPDGETHQGVFDIACLRVLPNMVIMAPKDENELQHMLYTAIHLNQPCAIRYPRGRGTGAALDANFETLPIGQAEVLRRGKEVLLLCLGTMTEYGLEVADALQKTYGMAATVVNARFVKPLDGALLARELPRHRIVCTIEDHVVAGGFGSAVIEYAEDNGITLQSNLKRFGIGDVFVPHAHRSEQHALNRYDPESVLEFILEQFAQQRAVGAA
jgi:1-deoxy-D-xylulose-5-phosphate synthase